MPADLRAPRLHRAGQQLRRRRTIPLATTLALGIGLLVAISTGLVLMVTGGALVRNTLDLLERRAELGLDLAEIRVREHLDPAADQVRFLSRLVAEGLFDPMDRSQPLDSRLAIGIGALSATPQVLALGFWPPGLESLSIAVRDPDGDAAVLLVEEAPPPGLLQMETATRAQTSTAWGDLLWVSEIGAAGLTVQSPLRRLDRYLGGAAAVVSARELSRLVLNVDIGVEGSRAFLLYGDSQVLAHPFLTMSSSPVGGEFLGRVLLPPLDALGDPVLAALFAAEDEATQPLARGAGQVTEVDLDGNLDPEFIVLTRTVEGYAPEPLILGVIMPIDSVDTEVQRMVVAGSIGLGVLVLAVLGGILTGKRMARPMSRLAIYADAVAKLEVGDLKPLPPSRLKEVDAQARAFNTLLAAMRWFQLYVPKTLVTRLMRQETEGTDDPTRSQARALTVMFTDIEGFTRASEGLSEQAVATWLNRHFSLIAAAVEAEGGTIDKYMGDAMMAFWGAPVDQPDHAERACRAALAMADAVAQDNPRQEAAGLPAIRLRVGIHTGRVLVGNIGAPDRLNYTIVGDAVNVGNRLETLAGQYGDPATPVTILISQSVQDRIGDAFQTEPLGETGLRGRDAGIAIYRLQS